MKMKYIDIDIADNRRFVDVALLVDNEQVLNDIYTLSTILGFPFNGNEYKEWIKHSERDEFPEDIFQKLASWFAQQPECTFVDYTNRKHVDTLTTLRHDYHKVYNEKFTIQETINFLTSMLCKRYRRNSNFKAVIRAALIRNLVTDEDYQTTVLRLFPHTLASSKDNNPNRQVFLEQPDFYCLALYFLPNTTKTELMKILDRDLPEAEKLYSELVLKQQSMELQIKDVIPNIKWYREWYWLHNQHSYQQIVNIESKKPYDKRLSGTITRDRIIQGIKAYKKLLAVETL